jgi:hypothetical protein
MRMAIHFDLITTSFQVSGRTIQCTASAALFQGGDRALLAPSAAVSADVAKALAIASLFS